MPRVPPPRPPLRETPKLRQSKAGPEIVLADGSVVPAKEVAETARWTALKLFVMLERYPFEWAEDRELRVPAVRKLVDQLARAAKWTFMHVSMGRRDAPQPQRFAPKAFSDGVKKIALQRFNANVPPPAILIRTGAVDDVQWEWSLVVHDNWLDVYAHDTPKNRKAMEKLFAEVRRAALAAPWATLGHGIDGAFSSALAGVKFRWGIASAFRGHEEAQLTPPWRAHVGSLWLDVPAAQKAAEQAASKASDASLDGDGLLIAQKAPASAVDRSAPRIAAERKREALRKKLGKIVNQALHDKAQRAELLGAKPRRRV